MNPPGASPQLTQFLSLFRVHKGHEFTHTSLGRPGGSFYIPSSSYEAFMGAYCAAVERGEDLFMTERHRHIGPAVVDLDFRFAADQQQQQQQQPVRLYTRETVKQIVRVISRAIGALVDLPEFECYVTEKPSPTLCKNLVKDGLHLAFPAVVTRPEVQHVLRSDILDPMARMLKEELPELVNSVEDIIDDAVIERNNWMMYGSKKPNCEPYVVTVRYRYTTETDALEEVPSDVTAATPATEYIQALSIRNKYDDVQVRSDHRERVECFIARREEEQRRREVIAGVMATSPNPTTNVCDSLEDCISFVSILNKDRASNYDDWVRLGWCLRNIDHRLLDTWDSFSRQSPKYIEGECPRLWNAMRAGGLGIGTLHMWARHDSPSQYMELLRAGLRGLLEDSAETATHYDVAQVVHHLYRYQYACCNIRNRTWYEFKDHRWRECESGYTLRARLSTDVFQEYRDLHKRLEDNLEVLAREVRGSREERMNSSSTSDGADRGNDDDMQRLKDRVRAMERRIKKTSDLGLKLKISAFKDNVLKECAELFYHEKFENKLNSNVDLLGFENGVLDLQRLEFREGRPDDYISFSTGINHVPYCPDHPIVKDIMHYWECVHTDPAMRKYVLTTIASCLSGRIREERFHIWTGSGSNAKSISISLLEKSLGDYCCKFPVTLMTQKRAASGAATPEIARAKGRRFAVLQEPSEDERLNVGQLKELSGGDVVQTRELFKAPCEWKPQFKLFLLCNTLPHVPSDDGGTWRRIRVVEFGSKFTENPNPDNPREFPVDLDLTSKLDSWREHFMAILIQYYKAYMSSTLCEPEPVLACTREYQRTNDHLADFVDSCIERVSGSEEDAGTVSLAIDDAFSEYKEWARNENIPAMQQRITKTTLLKYLTRYLGKPNAHSSGARTKKGDPSAWKGARIYSNAPTMNASLDAV